MSRISQLQRVLKDKGVQAYRILENTTRTQEQFYVLQKLETTRETETVEDQVTVYTELNAGDAKRLGSASFIVSHKLTKRELEKKIDEALYAAAFAANEFYELEEGTKKKSVRYRALSETPFEILKKTAEIFVGVSKDDVKFNSLELFFNEKEVHLVNSRGIDYKKTTFELQVEAIPSYAGPEMKTELYRMFRYSDVNYDKIREDAEGAVADIYNRAHAVSLPEIGHANIILHDKEVLNLMSTVISSLSYNAVYSHANLKNVGDDLQVDPACPITLSLTADSKSDFFDADGVLLAPAKIIENGKVTGLYGTSRFAYYLKKKPTGSLKKVVMGNGKKSLASFKKKPYIEIFDLSGLQADAYQNYLGGEVRLAMYFDGKELKPVSGFCFTANLQEVINTLELSREKSSIQHYEGPKAALLKNIEVN